MKHYVQIKMLIFVVAMAGCNRGQGSGETENASGTSAGTNSVDTVASMTDTSGTAAECPGTTADTESCNVGCQDCPASEKCVMFGDGQTFDQTACRPIPEDPRAAGENCAWSADDPGGDDCEKGSVCVDFPLAPAARCLAYCQGAAGSWRCPDASTRCIVLSGRPVCAPVCDPLNADACAWRCRATDLDCPGWGCFPMTDHGTLTCWYNPQEEIPKGEACTFNECADTLFCGPPGRVPGCDASTPCCTPYCDLKQPACDEGTACEAVFFSGQAPQGLEDLGACLTPN